VAAREEPSPFRVVVNHISGLFCNGSASLGYEKVSYERPARRLPEPLHSVPWDSAARHCPIHDLLAHLGDKWSMLVLVALAQHPDRTLRFSELGRRRLQLNCVDEDVYCSGSDAWSTPVLNTEISNTSKFPCVGCDEGQPQAPSVRSNEKIVCSNHCSLKVECATYLRTIRRCVAR